MASTVASVVRRALLYVPSSSAKYLEKSKSLTVDTLCYDLEDSVTPTKKDEARSTLRRFLEQQSRPSGIREQAVRINAVDSGLALKDLNEVLQAPNIDALVVPKVNSASDLHFVTDVLRHVQPDRHPSSLSTSQSSSPIKIIALIESAKSLVNLSSICTASPYLHGLIFAAEDFALDLSLTRSPSLTEMLFARSSIVTAARAHGIPSAIDLVCTAYKGEQGLKALEEECLGGKGLGFNGKQCIHPSQVEVVQKAYSPGEEEIEWAVRIGIADEKAVQMGKGAWGMDGKMIDMPVIGKASAVVKRAEDCALGETVRRMMEKWKDQKPE